VAKIVPLTYADATIIFTCAGITENLSSSIGFSTNVGQTGPEIAEGVHSALVSSGLLVASNMMTAYGYVGIEVGYMQPGGMSLSFRPANFQGAIAQPPCPVNCSQLVTKQTAAGGRQNRGRMFWPVCDLDEASIDPAGIITEATRVNRQFRWNDFLTALVANDCNPVLFHNTRPDGSDPPIVTPTPINGFALATRIATQRRRMR